MYCLGTLKLGFVWQWPSFPAVCRRFSELLFLSTGVVCVCLCRARVVRSCCFTADQSRSADRDHKEIRGIIIHSIEPVCCIVEIIAENVVIMYRKSLN